MEGVEGVEDNFSMRGESMEEKNKGPGKKAYEPPTISVISLRPEEAVLGSCKNSSSAGPVGGSCTIPQCMVPGS
jgi:hypothetical protein